MAAFSIVDWVLFTLSLVICAGIGVFYAFCGGKQQTTQEVLLADRYLALHLSKHKGRALYYYVLLRRTLYSISHPQGCVFTFYPLFFMEENAGYLARKQLFRGWKFWWKIFSFILTFTNEAKNSHLQGNSNPRPSPVMVECSNRWATQARTLSTQKIMVPCYWAQWSYAWVYWKRGQNARGNFTKLVCIGARELLIYV